MLWAEPGLVKFEQQLKKLKQEPKENELVSSDFFETKGIEKGWLLRSVRPAHVTRACRS